MNTKKRVVAIFLLVMVITLPITLIVASVNGNAWYTWLSATLCGLSAIGFVVSMAIMPSAKSEL